MDWIYRLQKAIDYIEAHLTDVIDYEEIAKQSFSSSFHFQRTFSILCGYTLGEYIRNRRLTLAGKELILGNAKVIDTALKYGYENPDSFSRAFAKFHGVTPSEAQKKNVPLRSFTPLKIKISLESGEFMDYRIEEKDSMTLVGYKLRFVGVPFGRQRAEQEEKMFTTTRAKQWLLRGASSGYQFANSPELALLHWRPITDKNNRFVEIWMPIESLR